MKIKFLLAFFCATSFINLNCVQEIDYTKTTQLIEVIKKAVAADVKNYSLAMELINNGANVNIKDNDGKSALYYAISKHCYFLNGSLSNYHHGMHGDENLVDPRSIDLITLLIQKSNQEIIIDVFLYLTKYIDDFNKVRGEIENLGYLALKKKLLDIEESYLNLIKERYFSFNKVQMQQSKSGCIIC